MTISFYKVNKHKHNLIQLSYSVKNLRYVFITMLHLPFNRHLWLRSRIFSSTTLLAVLLFRQLKKLILPGWRMHPWNGSPTYPGRQVHKALWFTTLHTALEPQLPGQGSLHFWLMQARVFGHSGFIVHSGRQLGGIPT